MSHVAERPELYVCLDCKSVYAGNVSGGTQEDHTYDPPSECAACGNAEFVGIEEYPHLG